MICVPICRGEKAKVGKALWHLAMTSLSSASQTNEVVSSMEDGETPAVGNNVLMGRAKLLVPFCKKG